VSVVYRSAVTGEYVSEEYALEHPATTVSETVPDNPPVADGAPTLDPTTTPVAQSEDTP
jgi:hypothetical protein